VNVFGINLVGKKVKTLQSLRLQQILNKELAKDVLIEVFDSIECVRYNEIYSILDNVSLLRIAMHGKSPPNMRTMNIAGEVT